MHLLKSIKSFRYALKGLKYVIRENNMQFHILAAILVSVAGFYFQLQITEWLWICSAIFMVFISETFNTAIEYLVNLVSPEYNPIAGKVKDLSAAAVLLAALYALLVAILVFVPKLVQS